MCVSRKTLVGLLAISILCHQDSNAGDNITSRIRRVIPPHFNPDSVKSTQLSVETTKDLLRMERALEAEKSDSSSLVLSLTQKALSDEFLDPYRIIIRVKALESEGKYSEALIEMEKITKRLDLWQDRPHPVIDDALALYLDLLSKSREKQPDTSFINANIGRSSFGEALKCALIYRDNDLTTEAVGILIDGFHRRGRNEEIDGEGLMKDPLRMSAPSLERERLEKSIRISEWFGWKETTDSLYSYLVASNPGDLSNDLLWIDILDGRKKRREALKLAEKVYMAAEGPSLKRIALTRAASIKYDLGRVSESARAYREAADIERDNPEGIKLLDICSRIYISLGRWNSALEVLEMIRNGPPNRFASESVVREASLMIWLGKEKTANGILKDNLLLANDETRPAYYFWIFRTALDERERSEYRHMLIEDYPESYYSEVALKGGLGFILPENSNICSRSNLAPPIFDDKSEDSSEIIRAVGDILENRFFGTFAFFLAASDHEEVSEILDAMTEEIGKDGYQLLVLALMLQRAGMTGNIFKIINIPFIYGSDLFRAFSFPTYEIEYICECASEYHLSPEFLLSVIREESKFDSRAVSRAGAIGLMQITTVTGRWIGEMMRIEFDADGLEESGINIKMGSWYLRYLLNRSKESYPGAISAYNAGWSRMSSWRKRFKPYSNPMLAVELIGVNETRRYVKRVLNSALIYHRIYNENEVGQ